MSILAKDGNTRINLIWILGNRDSMHDMCISHMQDTLRIETARVTQEEETD